MSNRSLCSRTSLRLAESRRDGNQNSSSPHSHSTIADLVRSFAARSPRLSINHCTRYLGADSSPIRPCHPLPLLLHDLAIARPTHSSSPGTQCDRLRHSAIIQCHHSKPRTRAAPHDQRVVINPRKNNFLRRSLDSPCPSTGFGPNLGYHNGIAWQKAGRSLAWISPKHLEL
jgi:hypothetical protein